MEKPLYQKLGIKDGFKSGVIGFDGDYNLLIGSILPVLRFSDYDLLTKENYNFIHIFTNDIIVLENSMKWLKTKIVSNGMLWYSWYKTSSKKQKNVNEDLIRDTALALGLVDVKVCSINSDWSGLKLVIPLKSR